MQCKQVSLARKTVEMEKGKWAWWQPEIGESTTMSWLSLHYFMFTYKYYYIIINNMYLYVYRYPRDLKIRNPSLEPRHFSLHPPTKKKNTKNPELSVPLFLPWFEPSKGRTWLTELALHLPMCLMPWLTDKTNSAELRRTHLTCAQVTQLHPTTIFRTSTAPLNPDTHLQHKVLLLATASDSSTFSW